MPVRTACPYCNAFTTRSIRTPRLTCDRCGDTFTPGTWEETSDAISTAAATEQKPSLRKPFLISSLIGLLAVAGALAYFKLWESKPGPQAPPREVSTQPPLTLRGLGYLPASTNIAFAVQPAALCAACKLRNEDPKEVLAKFNVPASVWTTFDSAGVPLEQIEQVVGGVTLTQDRLIPGLALVVILRSPGNNDAILKALHAERKPVSGKTIYTTSLNSLLMTPLDDRSWLFGLSDDDLKTADKPFANTDHLPASLKAGMSEEISPASIAWLVTENRTWTDASPLLKADFGKKLATRLAPARAASVGIAYEPELTLKATLDVADAASAEAVATWLKDRGTVTVEATRVRVETPEIAKLIEAASTAIKGWSR